MEQKMYKAACYCRLSDDDANDGMSVSIETQITIHKQYCKANQIQIVMMATQAQTLTALHFSVCLVTSDQKR